ncbi:vacuolar protein sorting-associated protein 9A-like [Impatiens glandulifera]|uniref:vacuolar protein sorting-associated protein 9A-like n=1 Tax=Impatiens glandulifera TaxID=253017 RepID=UPI001FB0693D|nr:vacuolar protein sorting-associated protein 9A-like [Impatiens glandulifera]XP_047320060.1 vacuolar protein sorting-associated protein 9A-like [Impatiens glandulifera]
MEATSSLSFYDFLDRMRNPASLDLVRSIKSFIVSFSFYTPNSESDGKRLQEFLETMEATIRDHTLWAGATEEEVDSAVEGLEKYVMTKLFSRTFAVSIEDSKADQDISEKICLLRSFLKPEHLDIPPNFHNESSWLLAQKELQKINAFKSPREKLLCIMSCCRIINNLLLNGSMSDNHVSGADDFLPILIYITIKSNPPQLHSNLKFIQLYRRESKLVSEAAYYFTNLVSVNSFIVNLDAKSLSIDENEFHDSMQTALADRAALRNNPVVPKEQTSLPSQALKIKTNRILTPIQSPPGSTNSNGDWEFPFMEAEAGELTVSDVEKLLGLYKEVVRRFTRGVRINNDPNNQNSED